jgi:hypothetical protein
MRPPFAARRDCGGYRHGSDRGGCVRAVGYQILTSCCRASASIRGSSSFTSSAMVANIGQIGFQGHPFDKSDQRATGADDIRKKIAIIARRHYRVTDSPSTRRPIYGFSAARVTRSTRRFANADNASSSARNSERPSGRVNSTSTSRSRAALASPRATDPNTASDPIGHRRFKWGARRAAPRVSRPSRSCQQLNMAIGRRLRPPRLLLVTPISGSIECRAHRQFVVNLDTLGKFFRPAPTR